MDKQIIPILPKDLRNIVYMYIEWDDHYEIYKFYDVLFTLDQLFRIHPIPTMVEVCRKKGREYIDVVNYIINNTHVKKCDKCMIGCENITPYASAYRNKYFKILNLFDQELNFRQNHDYLITVLYFQHISKNIRY